MITAYYKLAKPGIIMGNLITATAGFILASQGHINILLLLATLVGISCIVGSACVFNNYIDREADEKMARTRNRPLPKRLISLRAAVIFAIILGLAGIATFALFTNLLTLAIALTGVFVYVIIYSLLKYRSAYATAIGSIAGAIPPLVGYCAASNKLDLGALILFAILVLWQMPHFFSIAVYRIADYTAASIPVLPITRGIRTTKIRSILYILAFIGVASLLTLFRYTGPLYLIAAAALGLTWLLLALKGFRVKNDNLWARRMFRTSLLVITVLSVMISLDTV